MYALSQICMRLVILHCASAYNVSQSKQRNYPTPISFPFPQVVLIDYVSIGHSARYLVVVLVLGL